VTVRVTDDGAPALSDSETIRITVDAANVPPVAVDDVATTEQDTAVVVAVLTNDTDADGDTLAVTSVTAPTLGTAAINADRTITYTPAGGYSGADSFSYTVTDGNGATSTAAVTVTIEPAGPSAPVVVNHLVSVTFGGQRFDLRTGRTHVSITITNTSATSITGPVWFVVTSISAATIPLVNATGTLADGSPYVDLTGLLGDGHLDPGESVTVWLAFRNPLRWRFTFTYELLGFVL